MIDHLRDTMKTYLAPVNEIDKKWYLVDAENKVLGRLASEIATRLRGKHKPTFSSFIDNGDFIVVTNAEKIQLTGNKLNDKKYYRHSGWMGGMKEASAKELLEKHPTDLLIKAVKGMLPRNKLGRAQLKKLKVYAGQNHPHAAQQPAELDI
jgi:large subunit ribosomal protein L13